jgi:hypothetical protein
VRNEMEYLKIRETQFRNTTNAISSRLWILKVFFFLSVTCVALLQIQVQNAWFKKNKII